MRYHRFAFLILAACFLLLSHPCVQAAETVDRIVAVVNGDIITLFELERRYDYLIKRMENSARIENDPAAQVKLRQNILNKMIEDILLRQQAERYQIKVSNVEVDNQVRQVMKEQGVDEKGFERVLRSERMTMDDYKVKMRNDILKHRIISGMVRRKVIVTDEEIQAYYDENRDQYVKDKQVELKLLMVPASEDLQAVKERIDSGELTFDEAVLQYSIGPGAATGGSLGALQWRDLAAEWRGALEGVKPGGITEPFEIQGNKALLQLVSLAPGEVKPLDQVREHIAAVLRQPKLESRYEEYMADLRSQAVIDIRL